MAAETDAAPSQLAGQVLRVAAAGSVDDGKSTLIGRLLVDAKHVLEDQVASASSNRAENGDAELNLAHLTDGLSAERERGITIDVAYRYFATPKRRFILADTPGHAEFTRNMVTGASDADASVILVDARHGLVDQSRRHISISALLRVPQLVLCVNKMDLVDYSEERFHEVRSQFLDLVDALDARTPHAIPICALAGDNVVERSENMPWYQGSLLLPLLEEIEKQPATRGGARFVVQRTGASDRRLVSGRLTRGELRPGDEVVVLPVGARTTVTEVSLFGEELGEACAPSSLSVRLADDVEVDRGSTLAPPDDPPRVTTAVAATVCWMSERPLLEGERYLVKHGSTTTVGTISAIPTRLDVISQEHRPGAERLELNDLGEVTLELERELAVDPFRKSRHTGSFLLIDPRTNDTVAGGMVR